MTSKLVINTAYCLPEVQTKSTWLAFLTFIEDLCKSLVQYQSKFKTREDITEKKESLDNSANSNQRSFNTDLTVTLETIESLFKNSKKFSVNFFLILGYTNN